DQPTFLRLGLTLMANDHVDSAHDGGVFFRLHGQNFAGTALVLAGKHDDFVAPTDLLHFSGSLQHFRRQRDDLHVVLGAKFARNRAEDTRAHRLSLVVDENGRVLVETDHAAVRTADVLGGTHHHGLHHIALLDAAARNGFLDRHHDDVADGGVFPLRAAQHLDAHDTTRAGIVRDVEVCLHLNHDWPPSSFLSGEASPPRSVQNPVYCALASACSA